MLPDKEEVAEQLAEAHFAVDTGVEEIYRLVGPDETERAGSEPIKLLEINRDTVAVGIQPVYFGTHPASGVLYSSVIVEVAPEEFTDALKERLKAEYGWTLDRAYRKNASGRRNGRR